MQSKRRLGMALTALLVVAAIVYGFIPPAVVVDASPVVRDALRVTVTEEGMTRVKDRFVVSAPVAGHLRRVALRVGDTVEQGMTLAELEPVRSAVLDPRSRAQASARVAAAAASLEAARENARAAMSDAGYARSEFQRLSKLCEVECVISADELERAEAQARRSEANRRSAEFAVEVARFELEAARTALQYSAAQPPGAAAETVQVLSPVAGQVLGLQRESEGVVVAGQPLLEIGDPGALEVIVDLLSTDAVKVEPGTRVLFERWGGEAVLEGRVRVVEPTGFTKVSALGVEEQRVWVVVDLISPPQAWQRLGDGYRVEAAFILWEGREILQIPSSALFRHAGKWSVFVIDDGRAQRREVTLGKRSGLHSQVLSGLVEGQEVILHPDESIEPGTRVQRRN
ncbi:MAG TPA: efflux RND transporter periplasmic adaptor subunit [Gammaproteobacteria bacterium]